MKLNIPVLVNKIVEKLKEKAPETYIVGGAVRDILSKKPVDDWDLATKAEPEVVQRLFKESYYDNQFGTVKVAGEHLIEQFGLKEKLSETERSWFSGQVFDMTTFRTEHGYSDRRRPDRVEWGKSIDEDLSRRDFTINAMALKIKKVGKTKVEKKRLMVEVESELIDPFAGMKDLEAKKIRAVGKAEERFNEDALRMMRAIRIGAETGFMIEAKTLSAIKKQAALLKEISWERIRDELLKTLASGFPADGILLMASGGILEYVLPELLEAKGVPQAGHHIYDVWTHAVESLRACPSSDPVVRLAALLHDVGKPWTYQEQKGTITFYNHEVVGTKLTREIAKRLRLTNEQTDKLVTLVRWHMFAYDPKMTDAAIRRFIRRVGRERINEMMLLRVGDRKGGGSKATSWRLQELQKRIGEQLYEPMSLKDLKVDGHDVMKVLKIKPGPRIGKILNQLFEEVMEDTSKNEKQLLLKRIKELAA